MKKKLNLGAAMGASVALAAAGVVSGGLTQRQPEKPAAPRAPEAPPKGEPKVDAAVLSFTVKDIEGNEVDLSKYKGKVVLITNVASKCGFTPQYEGLQKLYELKKDEGLVVLGFPANNFNGQEPGDEEEIAAFCRKNYGVTFPLFEKISVKGPDQHPLYRKLAAQPAPIGGDPKWNFTKFVVDRSGNVVARFDADKKYVRTPELEPELLAKVDELLKQK